MSEEKQIRVYHTHIEVYPYKLHENERIEKMMSVWVEAEFRYDQMAWYIWNDTLYLPRGFNLHILEMEFRAVPFVIRECDKSKSVRGIHLRSYPKNRIQEEAIEFLTCEGRFKDAWNYSQQALLLDTGDGKTFTTISSIIFHKTKAIIITHQDKIKKQWIAEFQKHTDIDPERLIDISGSDDITGIMKERSHYGYFYFVNHQTLQSYARNRGWIAVREFFKEIEVGIKVFDEAHLSFKNVCLVDFFSNVRKTFYLTANFGRSDTKEEMLFRKCFSSAYQFGEETKNYEEKRRHIIYIPVLYKSNPDYSQLAQASNAYGFSVLGFSKYALHEDEDKTQLKMFDKVYRLTFKLDGKVLITVPRISDTEFIRDYIYENYGKDRIVLTINSKNTIADNSHAKENADVVVSTIKSCGTGVDIKKLRVIINLEPFSSNITTNQLSGRLREYSKDKDTYFFDLIDEAFSVCSRQYRTKLRYLKKKCKEIKPWYL